MGVLEKIENDNKEFAKLAESIMGKPCLGKAYKQINGYVRTDMIVQASKIAKSEGFKHLAVSNPVQKTIKDIILRDLGITIYSMPDLLKSANIDQMIALEKYGQLTDKE